MRRWVWLAAVAAVLTGCETARTSAPVVEGYKKPVYRSASAKSSKFTDRVSARTAGRPTSGFAAYSTSALDSLKTMPVREDEVAAAAMPPAVVAEPLESSAPSARAGMTKSSSVFVPSGLPGGGVRQGSVSGESVTYKVAPGDTVFRIARRYNVTPKQILAANGLASTADLPLGSTIRIPTAGAAPVAVASRDEAGLAAVEPAAGPKPAMLSSSKSAVAASAEPSYAQHTVAPGETIYRIATMYHSSVLDIMSANDFEKPQDLKLGSVIRVPLGKAGAGAAKPLPVDKEVDAGPSKTEVNPTAAAELKAELLRGKVDPVAARADGLAWPAKGPLLKHFGDAGNGVAHTGINIKVPMNSQVVAVAPGKVLYAGGGLKTYGNLVLIRHDEGLVTAYAHNSILLVKKGDSVKKGQILALSGVSGNVEEPQLHFEVRKNAQAVDPLSLLPRPQTAER